MRAWVRFVVAVAAFAVAIALLGLAVAPDEARSKSPAAGCTGGASSITATSDDGALRASAPVATGCTR